MPRNLPKAAQIYPWRSWWEVEWRIN